MAACNTLKPTASSCTPIRSAHSSRYRVLKTVATDSHGYWTLSSSTAGADWRVRWKSPAGVTYEGPPIRAN